MADQPLAYMDADFLESDDARPLRMIVLRLSGLTASRRVRRGGRAAR